MELSKFFPKKEVALLTNNVHVLKKFLGGIEDMLAFRCNLHR